MSDRDILTDPQWQAFQRQLDAQPDSHDTRAVLADWLEGQGHPWARAYRWMARMEKYPSHVGWFLPRPFPDVILPHCHLLLSENIGTLDHSIFCLLTRSNAEIRLCELFDELPLVGKEEYADV